MFFEKDDDPPVDDVIFDKIPTLKYFTKTRKVLKMQRVFTKPRAEVFGNSEINSCIPNVDTLSQAGVPPKYQEEGMGVYLFVYASKLSLILYIAALQFWNTLRDDKLAELHLCLEKQKITDEEMSKDMPDLESDENVYPGTSGKQGKSENT